MVRAEGPLAVGEGAFKQRSRLGQPASLAITLREAGVRRQVREPTGARLPALVCRGASVRRVGDPERFWGRPTDGPSRVPRPAATRQADQPARGAVPAQDTL